MKMSMRIGTRILAGYGLALVVVGGIGFVAYRAITELVGAADLVTHTRKVKETLSDVLSALKDAESGQRGFLLTGEERYLEPYNAAVQVVDRQEKNLRELTADNLNQQKRIATLEPLAAGILAELAATITLRRQRQERAAAQVVASDRGKAIMDQIRRVIGEMDDEENQLLTQRIQLAKATAHFATSAMLWGGLFVLVLVSTVGLLIQRSITGPLAAFMQFVGRVGEGDLTHQAKISSGDELGELARHLDQMVAGLKDVASQTRLATENLNSASAEILASTQQQASVTGEQAAAIQQTTTTMEEVAQSGAQMTERAKQVAASAEAASAASHAGLHAVESTNRTMETIREQAEAVAEKVVSLSERTQAIGEIISTVNDLAEQSHLLALNAALRRPPPENTGGAFRLSRAR
jgi:methyl-accepting chemotaxis protein